MDKETPINRSDFEMGKVVTNGRLDLLIHYRNGQRIRGIVNRDSLAKTMTWYAEEFCGVVENVRLVTFYNISPLQPNAVPINMGDFSVTPDYINHYFGHEAKKKILTYVGEFRKKISENKSVNRFKDLMDKPEVVTFFNPGKPAIL